MLPIRLHRPSRVLQPFIQFYAQREVKLGDPLLVHPVPARSSPMLEFVFGDPIRFTTFNSQVEQVSPHIVFVGMQTRPFVKLRMVGSLLSFVIMFHANAVERMFGCPAHELTDGSCDGRALLGPQVGVLYHRLSDCTSFEQRIELAESFLLSKLSQVMPLDRAGAVAELIRRSNGRMRMPELSHWAGASSRQLTREFNARFGVGPKMFSRIVRFQGAIDQKARSGNLWTEIAHDFGYHDQMHMVHDFNQFIAGTPTETLQVVESLFSDHIRDLRAGLVQRNHENAPRFIV